MYLWCMVLDILNETNELIVCVLFDTFKYRYIENNQIRKKRVDKYIMFIQCLLIMIYDLGTLDLDQSR